MDAISARLLDGIEDGRGVQVGLGARVPSERIGLVGQPHMEGISIGIGVHRHRLDAHLTSGTNDADGNFAAVGDQDLLQHEADILVDARAHCHTS